MPTVPSPQGSLAVPMKRRQFLQAVAAASVVPSQALAQSGHDLAVVNARIMTMDPSRPAAEAVLIRNGHIAMVGSSAAMAAWPFTSNGSMEVPAAISVPLIKSRLVISLISTFRTLYGHKQLSIIR